MAVPGEAAQAAVRSCRKSRGGWWVRDGRSVAGAGGVLLESSTSCRDLGPGVVWCMGVAKEY